MNWENIFNDVIRGFITTGLVIWSYKGSKTFVTTSVKDQSSLGKFEIIWLCIQIGFISILFIGFLTKFDSKYFMPLFIMTSICEIIGIFESVKKVNKQYNEERDVN